MPVLTNVDTLLISKNKDAFKDFDLIKTSDDQKSNETVVMPDFEVINENKTISSEKDYLFVSSDYLNT